MQIGLAKKRVYLFVRTEVLTPVCRYSFVPFCRLFPFFVFSKKVDNSKITKIRLTITTTSNPYYTCANYASASGENVATKLIKVRSANPALTFLSFQVSLEKRQSVDINL